MESSFAKTPGKISRMMSVKQVVLKAGGGQKEREKREGGGRREVCFRWGQGGGVRRDDEEGRGTARWSGEGRGGPSGSFICPHM